MLKAAADSDEPVSRAIEVAHPAHRTLRVHAVRLPPIGAARAGTVAVLHDVTELMQLEKMRREFVANASHELRTPLAAIRGFAETLLGGAALSEADRRAYLEVIDRHARRLSTLVGDLLELSKIESRETKLERAPIDLAKLAETLLHDWRARLDESQLTATLHSERAAVAWADAQACEQILSNLLDNAIKYTEPGGSIAVRTRRRRAQRARRGRRHRSGNPASATCRGSSSASTGSTRRARAPRAEPASGSRS